MRCFSSPALISQRLLSSQVLASVVWQLFPNVTLVGGGSNSLGFYYDFVLEQPLTENLIELIEVNLSRFIKEGHSLRFISMMRENAQALFEHKHHFLLAHFLTQEKSNILEFVQINDFYGLCPHLSFTTTEELGYIKILDVQKRTQVIQGEELNVTRLIGVSQSNSKDLKNFIKNYHSFLKKRDHRILGPKLNLFSFSEKMGNLGVIWHPKGITLRRLLQGWLNDQLPTSEKEISTPLVVKQNFLVSDPLALEPFLFEGEEYQLRTSLLRQHLEFLQNFPADREELPWKIREEATVYHYYPESQWWGLLCTCAYLTDHTTICCLEKQVVTELISSLHFIEQIITIFGFKAQWYLVASRQKSLKAQHEQVAIEWLKQALQSSTCSYAFSHELEEEEEVGEGPRLELRIQDAVGREWPASTLGVAQQIKKTQPLIVQQAKESSALIVVTRKIWGSLDRLIALLIEHYEGNLPLWLAPEQVRVISIGEASQAYAKRVSQSLREKRLRVGLDLRQEKLSVRVHEAEKENVPYVVLLGEQERVKQRVSFRVAGKGSQNESVDLETFLSKLYQESLSPIPLGRMAMLKGESESA